MYSADVQIFGRMLQQAIETGQPVENIGNHAQNLVAALGGNPHLYSRDAGCAALYIVALMAAKGE